MENKTDVTLAEMDTLLAEFETQMQVLQEQLKDKVRVVFKGIFDANEEIRLITWTQYTPYFNDGDPCEFGVNEIYVSNAPDHEHDNVSPYGEYDGETEGVYATSGYPRDKVPDHVKVIASRLNKTLGRGRMRDVMKAIFGDHVAVKVTRTGIQIDEYEHE